MSMTADQVGEAVADFIWRASGSDGGLRLINKPVVDEGANTIVFKISVPAGTPLTGVGEVSQTVTLTYAIS